MSTLTEQQIRDKTLTFIKKIDNYFTPPLKDKVNINEYTDKILKKAYINYKIFNNDIIALFAGYISNGTVYITLFAVDELYHGQKISHRLLKDTIDILKEKKIKTVKLEVYKNNTRAICFYEKFNFKITNENDNNYFMSLSIC